MPHLTTHIRQRMLSPHAQALFRRFLIGLLVTFAEVVIVGLVIMNLGRFFPAPDPSEMKALYEECDRALTSCDQQERNLRDCINDDERLWQRMQPRLQDAHRQAYASVSEIRVPRTDDLRSEFRRAPFKCRIDSEQATQTDLRQLRQLSVRIHCHHDTLETIQARLSAYWAEMDADPEFYREIIEPSLHR